MKKFITIVIAFAAIVMLISCKKDYLSEINENKIAEVSFSTNIVSEGHIITRSASTMDNILSLNPSYLPIRLVSLRNRNVFTFNTNEKITLPCDKYSISIGYDYMREDAKVIHNLWDGEKYVSFVDNLCKAEGLVSGDSRGYANILKFPIFKIVGQSEIDIKEDGNIELYIEYACSCIVFNLETIKTITKIGTDNLEHEIKCMSYFDNNAIIFVRNQQNGNILSKCTFFLYPQDENKNERTKVDISGDKLEYGKYYVVNCGKVSTTEATIDIDIPQWEESEL